MQRKVTETKDEKETSTSKMRDALTQGQLLDIKKAEAFSYLKKMQTRNKNGRKKIK